MEKINLNPLNLADEPETACLMLNARIEKFRNLMEPALHLFPDYLIPELMNNGFFTSPASRKYHGSHEGGLFEHSRNVAEVLLSLTIDARLVWSRPESPYIIGMFHDICKMDLYRHPEVCSPATANDNEGHMVDASKWVYNSDILLKGHGDKSVMLLSQYVQLTMEEIVCIRYHMGAFVEKEEWNDYTKAIHRFPNVLWTHHADMIAAHIWELDS